MASQHSPRNEIMTLEYWQAIVTFGPAAVEAVLREPEWTNRYPELLASLASVPEAEKRKAVLPEEVLLAMAAREDCVDDFYADPDGSRLYAVRRRRPWAEPSSAETDGLLRIPSVDALRSYGAFCLFNASDRGIGYKGERPS
jgi:hypothetical protein